MNAFDSEIAKWLNSLSGNSEAFDDVVRIFGSDYLMPMAFALSLFGLWFIGGTPAERPRRQWSILIGITGLALSNGIVTIINHIWDRDRPYLELDEIELVFYRATDGSFPSNPVAVGFAAGAGAWMVNRRFGWVLFTFGALYGVSRIYMGVFYPTDVLGGAAVGIVSTWLSIYIHRLWQPATALSIRFARAVGLG